MQLIPHMHVTKPCICTHIYIYLYTTVSVFNSLCMRIYVQIQYIYIYTYIFFLYIYILLFFICIHVLTHIHLHIHLHLHLQIHLHTYISIYMYLLFLGCYAFMHSLIQIYFFTFAHPSVAFKNFSWKGHWMLLNRFVVVFRDLRGRKDTLDAAHNDEENMMAISQHQKKDSTPAVDVGDFGAECSIALVGIFNCSTPKKNDGHYSRKYQKTLQVTWKIPNMFFLLIPLASTDGKKVIYLLWFWSIICLCVRAPFLHSSWWPTSLTETLAQWSQLSVTQINTYMQACMHTCIHR